MLKRSLSRFISLLLAATLLAGGVFSAAAQTTGFISITEPDLSAYPEVTTTFTAIDDTGAFIKNLRLGELRVMENSITIPSYTLEMNQVGVRFVVAINEGPTLDNRFSGVMRIDRIKTALFNWVNAQPEQTMDEFYLVVNQGPLQMNPADPGSWKTALEGYTPDLTNATPGMASFSTAVDNALNSSLQTPKTTALLFITPLPTEVQLAGMQEIIARAKSNGIRVSIWLVGPQDYTGSEAALRLEGYARETGGQYFLFSGAEELPLITDLLDPLEYQYHLTYQTPANISGEYNLVLEITRGDTTLTSEPVTYSLSITPPNPIFLSPPSQVTRSWTEEKKRSESVLTPGSVEIEIVVEFPDGKPRQLTSTRLFVDGGLVDENTEAPFDTFTWDISSDSRSTIHNLQVIIEDVTGLKGQTIQIPVEVVVEEQNITATDRIREQLTSINGIIAGIVVLVTLFGLVLLVTTVRKKTRKKVHAKQPDPVTEPVRINGEYTLAPEPAETKTKWPVIRGIGLAPARLIQKRSASPDIEYLPEIPLGNEETLIGSERRKVDHVLVHPTISPLHARIFKDADGNFRIADSGSAAGTWVNYAPVSTRGAQLEHGDLVQFGRLAYIFEIHGAAPRRVKVLPYKED